MKIQLHKWILPLLLLLGALFRFWGLTDRSGLIFDEVHYVPAAGALAHLRPRPDLGVWATHSLVNKSPDTNFFHPPLGKILMGVGMRLFGDKALGWRIFSAILGLASLFFFFQLAEELLQDRRWAGLATFLMCVDFIHIAQSRLAMLDIYVFFFCILGMLSLLYLMKSRDTVFWSVIAVLSWVCAISTKTVSVLSFGGFLGLLFCIEKPLKLKLKLAGSILASVVAIFSLWWLFYVGNGYGFWEWIRFEWFVNAGILKQGLKIHPYGSAPIAWLVNSKPIWYFFQGGTSPIGIVGFGNPAVWLAFVPATYILYANWVQKKEATDRFILIWFLCSYLPLFLILWKRQGFIYYMLLSLAPMCLAIARALAIRKVSMKFLGIYLGIIVLATLVFLPFVLGIPISTGYYRFLTALISV